MKYCPNCHSESFIVGCSVQDFNVNIDFEDGEVKVINTPQSERKVQKLVMCASCHTRFDLGNPDDYNKLAHQKVKCAKCGQEYEENEVDENNVCIVCQMKEKHEQLQYLEKMSEFDLIKLIAMLQSDNDRLSQEARLNKILDSAISANEKIEAAESSVPDAIPEEDPNQMSLFNENEEEPKKKRRGRKKKADTENVNQVEPDNVDIDSSNEENSDIEINDMSAPELPSEIKNMSEELNEVE